MVSRFPLHNRSVDDPDRLDRPSASVDSIGQRVSPVAKLFGGELALR
jgi:hypothetical protein